MSAPIRLFGRRRSLPWPALIGAIVLVAAGAVMAFYEEHLNQVQRLQEAHEEAAILAASETAALSFRDRKAAEEYVQSLEVNPQIAAVAVYGNDGEMLAAFTRAGHAPPPPVAVAPSPARLQGDAIIVVLPVIQQKTRLGTVYLRAASEPMENRALRQAVFALLMLMALIVIGGLGTAQIHLERQARRLEESNLRLQEEIAERAKAEEALRQSQKMEAIGQLSGAIAHDFNNLLMIVKGNLHLMQRRLSIPSDDRHMHAAMEGVKRAAALTQRILAFSRKQDLSPVALDVNELILGMDDLVRNSLRENIEILRELRSRCWTILDRNQMENVMLNLVINARDAMPEGGKLIIRTEDLRVTEPVLNDVEIPRGDYVRITVKDTGMGMSEQVRARALDPFFTTKPPGQGTGLGLSTTFGFISQSGGFMHLESAPGCGTTISILLPETPPDRHGDANRS